MTRPDVTATPLLETKFRVPKRRRKVVTRARLTRRLSDGAESALTVVSAPAGFGKSTLLTEWLATTPTRWTTAWLSLGPGDNDPAVFWAYLMAALQTATAELPQSPPSPTEAALATLLNHLAGLPDNVVLVLDDYHVIEAHEVHDALAYLLEHLPPQVHVVIASRTDPPLPLARLRARGELVEIRAADLRFTTEEAAAYLNQAMGLDVTAADVAALEERTEGWIAALQLAALSMQGRDDIPGFIAQFAGDDRYIVDYLVGEVLQRQPDDVRRFLLRTSVLNRLDGALADAVTEDAGGRAMLEALDRANLFLIPLDDRRHWYRYHHLFADVLRARLLDEQPDEVPGLHRRASAWWEQHGDRAEAVSHSLAGEDFERAADLIELAAAPLHQARQEATLHRWLDALPDELVALRPVLAMNKVGLLMARGEVDGLEVLLGDIERGLEVAGAAPTGPGGPGGGMVVVDEAEFRRLPAQIAMWRAGQAHMLGDVAGTIAHATRTLELAAPDDHIGRGGAAALLGLALWTLGDLDAAHRRCVEGKASLEKAGHVSDALGMTIALADIRIAQGRLEDAMSTYQRALSVTSGGGRSRVLRGTADMHTGLSGLLRERNELDAALQHLVASEELGEHGGLPQNAYRSRVARAGLREVGGDLDGAADLLEEAERLYVSDYFPDVRPVAALRARLRIVRGDARGALRWARGRRLTVEDELSYLLEFEHVTLARALLAEPAAGQATRFLERLIEAAELGGRTGSVIEILVLQALAHHADGAVPAAKTAIDRALTLAEPEGYVRVFLDEGRRLTALLRDVPLRGVAQDHAKRLLASDRGTAGRTSTRPGLVDPLSERELDVLRLLRTDLSGPEIARELLVSLNTMRTHTKSIYSKLGVNTRRGAVRRADELGV
ncbi:MAG: hypothetical protein QOE93_1206 [Actinomycetota bacterium]|nr:hypothetical protein [Actinomycetota bacterium]